MKKVILCISNDITIDQRLHKVCLSLLKAGYKPLLVGVTKSNSLPLASRAYVCHRLPMFFDKGKFFYAELNIRLFFFLLFNRTDIITANDLDTILPCFLVSRLKNKRLVYDSHEYFTELPELKHRKFERTIWTMIESFIFPRLKKVSTVGNSIAKEYQKKYNVPVSVVRNLPLFLPINQNYTEREKIIIYQGAVNLGRGIELMCSAMQYLPEYELWIIGQGPLLGDLSDTHNNMKNVKFKGRKNFQELYNLTIKGAVGLSLEEDLGLNYRYALPNKIFDYVQAELPVIVSDLPEMRSVVDQYKIGAILFEREPKALADLIRNVFEDRTQYHLYVQNCRKATVELNWENQEEILLDLYR